MVHFRVTEGLLDYVNPEEYEKFIVGNIGPDCGVPSGDGRTYIPLKYISHWWKSKTDFRIDADRFFNNYVKDCKDRSLYPFYLAYYTHLLTDILWVDNIYLPTREKFSAEYKNGNEFDWTVKKDWYDLDHLFLKENPNFKVFRIFEKISSFPNVYIDYFTQDAFEIQIKNISKFYNDFHGDLDREYPYLNKEQSTNFVSNAISVIRKKLDIVLK